MTSRDRSQHNWRLAFLVWLTVLTIATHLPQGGIANQSYIESPDKLLHTISFGMLAFLFMCCGWIKNKWLAWSIIALWAVIDETTQGAMRINRPFSTQDLIAGEIGIGCAMMWMGSLHSQVNAKILGSIEVVLSRGHHWLVLGFVAVVSTIVPCVVLWFMVSQMIAQQINGFVMLVGIVVGTSSVLLCLVKIGSLESEIVHFRKNMAMMLSGTILIAAMVGFFTTHTYFDPWVAVLACLVIGAKAGWNRAIRLQIEKQSV